MAENSQQGDLSRQHFWMCFLGGAAGLAMWVLFDVLPDSVQNQRFLLLIASATVAFFVLLFALLDTLRWQEAAIAAAILSFTDAALLYWASGRFIEFDNLFEESFAPLAWGLILFIGAPFASAVMKGRGKDYEFLFENAWNIVVRYVAAWIFVGLFWGLLQLSDELLSIVGVTVIDALIDIDPIPFLLTGAALGLALSVAQDLKAYVSPYLPLRLLRLLLPMVLVVVSVFILALPVRGLSQLFGDFSAATILMSVAFASITLITSAIDKADSDGVRSQMMQRATKALALVLPFFSALALWAVWVRVGDYGWTPQRLAAGLASLLIIAYAVLYGLAVFQNTQWQKMIRQSNIAMAIVVMVLSGLWMTPLMNAQKYAAQSQLQSYLQGEVSAQDFPAWEMTHTWGRAGKSVVAHLHELRGDDHAEIHARLARAKDQSRWEFNQSDETPTVRQLAKEVQENLQVWPEGRSVELEFFENAGLFRLEEWASACDLTANRPCILVFGPFSRQGTEKAFLFVPRPEGGAAVFSATNDADNPNYFVDVQPTLETGGVSESAYLQIKSGGFRIGPSSRQSLWLGDVELTTDN